jgi:hypothetical protein
VARRRQQLIEHARVCRRPISAHLGWAWAVFEGTDEEPSGGHQIPILGDEGVDDLAILVIQRLPLKDVVWGGRPYRRGSPVGWDRVDVHRVPVADSAAGRLSRNQAIVLAKPSSKPTVGSQPRTLRARAMSGWRTVGSSSGRGT